MVVICNKVREGNRARATAETVIYDQSEIISLVEKAAGGNLEAFGELYGIYIDHIYRYVFYQVKDKMTAEDITEEVFVKAWKAIGSCKGKGQTFLPWLYRIAHNHLISYLRRSRKCLSAGQKTLTEADDPELEAEAKIERDRLLEAISCLPLHQKQVIILKFIEGLDNREIGKIIGKSQGAIRVLKMRALAKLRRELDIEARQTEIGKWAPSYQKP
jgi:RNA polymerase sigma-70 factor (ECF subfamily)